MAANKIFEADIFVKFKNFEQEEIQYILARKGGNNNG